MRDEGYTLGECLVALFVVGLALGGLSAGALSIRRQHASAVETTQASVRFRAVEQNLARFVADQGPFVGPGAAGFQGTQTRFQFPCGADDDCRVWLTGAAGGTVLHLASRAGERSMPMAGARSAQFIYAGTRTIGPQWPADDSTRQPLKSISLMAETAAGSVPVATVPIWIDQSVDCEFDATLRDCRH